MALLFYTLISDRYGSKKGCIRHFYHKILYLLGGYRKYKVSTSMKPNRLVFVCDGNICRSPLAEAAARKQGFESISVGLNTRGGDQADCRAIAVARDLGIDLSTHLSSRIQDYVFNVGDLFVAMEPRHLTVFRKLNIHAPIILLGLSGNNTLPYIHDPFSSNEVFFLRCERNVVEMVGELAKNVSIKKK